jgi:hypothetical protein
MQNHLNLKTLSFYGAMIGSVVVLFKVVSAYGETNLKAPNNLSGSYSVISENLPPCLQSQRLTDLNIPRKTPNPVLNLNIEQSGIYVFANLSLTADDHTNNTSAKEVKIPLTGKIKHQEAISLTGKGNQLKACPQLATNNPQGFPNVQFTPKGKENLTGEIRWNSSSPATIFTAQLQESETKEEGKH